ncbi:MAG: hypothetical protein QGF46_05325, partial [Planctomycetota bacterium]|nr:hypothetical protein [Planctomycetota bacterium]
MTTAPASAKKLTATEVAALLSAELIGSSDAEFGQVQDLKTATANEVSFFRSAPNEMGKSPSESDYQTLRQSGAGLILVDAHCPPPKQCHIKVDDPGLAATILAQFWQCRRRKLTAQIHPSAVIDPSADVAPSAFIGANCVIGANVKIGANTILHPAVVVYDDVQ